MLQSMPVDESETKKALHLLEKLSVAVFIVAYNAESHIYNVLNRIPEKLRNEFAEVYLIDDSSEDLTYDVAVQSRKDLNYIKLTVLRTPFNRGYGGNQKLGYLYALKKGFDIVVLLHGDGQYAPEYLPQMISPFEDEEVGAVFGSRMIHKLDALKGGMPFYKWVGNRILTGFENSILRTSLSEFHTGYRAYRISTLRNLPFLYNSDGFHFDTEIIIQLLATGKRIREVKVPTFYGDELCHVNGVEYALNCAKSVIKYRLTQLGLFYEPYFDFKLFEEDKYFLKLSPNSLHQYVLQRNWDPEIEVCELGAYRGDLSAFLAEKVKKVTCVDLVLPERAGKARAVTMDLDGDFDKVLGTKKYDAVIALDLIEHLNDPHEGVRKIFRMLKPRAYLYASTGNIGYLITRLGLLLGQFNYGKRGILDLTHKKLFTIYSFKKLLKQNGFVVKEMRSFGPPIFDMISQSTFFKVIDTLTSFLARMWPSLFAYNFLIIAQRMDDIEDIYNETLRSESSR